jgi:DNA-binding transcriptional MerR regulator
MPQKTVSEVASLAGVTVRTLHHYDEIGLLRPSGRTESGYRLYGDADLARLHDIVLWRSLGFPLDEVRALIEDPNHDPTEALKLHRQRLVEQIGQLNERIAALDEAIRKSEAGEPMEEVDLKAIFDGFDPAEHEAEAEARWGDTEAFRESKRRAAKYTAADWLAIKAEAQAVTLRLAEVMKAGLPPTSPEAAEAAQAHRAHMTRWFYDCTPEIHAGLGRLYVEDARFTATYDKVAPGLAQFISDAIAALYAPKTRRL